MKHLFQKNITYQCDLGEMTLVEFLEDWVNEQSSIFSSQYWKKDVHRNYVLKKIYSKNHFVVSPTVDSRFPSYIDLNYTTLKEITFTFSQSKFTYVYCLLWLILTIFIFSKSTEIILPLLLLTYSILQFSILLPSESKLNEARRNLELELRYHKIPYQVINGEPIYLPS